jgi:phosphatidylserine decarboxylase
MAKEGIPFVAAFLVPACLLALVGMWGGAAVFLVLAVYMVYFFRDPSRDSPSDDTLIVSPADGKVVRVEREGPAPDSATQVSIFLSPLDVHINRSPISGEVTGVVYKQGAFHVATREIASVENEQNVVTLRGRHVTIVLRQIAGVLARRVVFWKKPGDRVTAGERVGLMKFGSRIDLLLPAEVEILVSVGDRVIGGSTVIGRARSPQGESDE